MDGPHQPPSTGNADQAAADKEARAREEAAQLAMMDDLGLTRVEELPLEDKRRDRNHGQADQGYSNYGHGNQGHGGHGRGNHGHSNHGHGNHRPSANFRGQQRILPEGLALTVETWREAISSGKFEDAAAMTVKGLDDLDGGRSYDTANQGNFRREDAMKKTMKILDYGKKNHRPPETPVPNKRIRSDTNSNKESARNNSPASGAPSSRSRKNRAQPPTSRALVPSAHRLAVARAPHPQPVLPTPASCPPMPVDLDLSQLSIGLGHIVFKVSVNFLSGDINPAMPAIVFLSAAKKPELGFFTVFILARKFCQWKISAWQDYTTGANHQLGVFFMDDSGESRGYDLFFATYDDLVEFMTKIRGLQAGNYLENIQSTSACALEPTVSDVSDVAATSASTVAAGTHAALIEAQAASYGSTSNDTPEPVGKSNASNTANGGASTGDASQEDGVNPTAVESAERKLIDLEVEDTSIVSSQCPSESAQLLATLEPYEYGQDLSLEKIIEAGKGLFFGFLFNDLEGATMGEMRDTVEGIKAGLLEHIMRDARARGLGPQKLAKLEATVKGVLASLGFLASLGASEHPDRVQYTAEQLLSMRNAAIEPPAQFSGTLDALGLRLRRQTSAPSRGSGTLSGQKPLSREGDEKPKAAPAPSTILKARNVTQWLFAENGSPDPESEQTGRNSPGVAEPGTTRDSVPRDAGLQNSRWAPEGAQIKHANSFTGPAYERAWSNKSHLKDLAQLDSQATVTAPAEHLAEFFFSTSDDVEEANPNSNSRGSGSAGRGPSISNASSRIDNIESLRVSISRLTIHSPQTTPAQPVQLPVSTRLPVPPSGHAVPAAEPPRLRGLAASRHDTGTAPTNSGKFNFYLPGTSKN